jgi:hypothetical protein
MDDELWYLAVCEQCEPGIRPLQFATAGERDEWVDLHVRETAHSPRVIDFPKDEGD